MLTFHRHIKAISFLLLLFSGIFAGCAIAFVADMPYKPFFVVALGLVFPFLALFIKDLRQFLLVASIVSIPIYLDVNFMHIFERQAGASTVGISLTDILLLILLFLWLLELASKDRPYAIFYARLTVPALLYIEAAALTLLWAPRLDLAIMEVFRMIKVCALYFILLNHLRDERDLRLAMWALIATVAFESMIAGLQIVKGGLLGLEFLGEAPADPDGDASLWRVMGTLGHPNKLATFIESLLLLCVGAFLIEKKKWLKIASLSITGLGLVTLIMTGTRGAWVGFVAAFITFLFFAVRNKHIDIKLILKPAIIVVLLMLMIGLSFSGMLTERIFGDDYGSAESRIPMFQIAFNIISAHPVGGVGINNYQVNMREYNDSVRAMRYTTIPRPVHNMYLLVMGETGLIGFAAMMLLLLSFISILVKTAASSSPQLAVIAICILSGVAAFCVHGLVDKHPPGGYAPFYAMMAVGASAYLIDRRRFHHS
ncbi:O-antigen ligase domain-containing protein [candidate division KSB1 bacterium]|nr:O-antigen ligase family protein [candidate division KSB1 bacterium]RQW04160.1 MAG: O-antigen ligase domain-containing protein [candidate division KSB1 bacterium]